MQSAQPSTHADSARAGPCRSRFGEHQRASLDLTDAGCHTIVRRREVVSERDEVEEHRRALSPDARLLPRLTACRLSTIKQNLVRARDEERGLSAAGAHAASLALKRVEIVELEDELGRARIAATYRSPDH
jgi:hypothetical protein